MTIPRERQETGQPRLLPSRTRLDRLDITEFFPSLVRACNTLPFFEGSLSFPPTPWGQILAWVTDRPTYFYAYRALVDYRTMEAFPFFAALVFRGEFSLASAPSRFWVLGPEQSHKGSVPPCPGQGIAYDSPKRRHGPRISFLSRPPAPRVMAFIDMI